jgi:hypothetical protein
LKNKLLLFEYSGTPCALEKCSQEEQGKCDVEVQQQGLGDMQPFDLFI